jgi:GTP-binding protein
MQIKTAVFHMSSQHHQNAPEWNLPEFAFIGRSNVGKSSMINMISNKDHLAKVSATPGKTRLLNFFIMNDAWSLVDLPGYGYAKVAKSEKVDFAESVGDYLEERQNLRRVFVLIDSRIPPQRIDVDFVSWLAATGVPFNLTFTKADKQSPTKTQATIQAFLQTLPPNLSQTESVIITSSKERTGRIAILKQIEITLAE